MADKTSFAGNMNIPALAVGEFVQEISALYISAVKGGCDLTSLPSVFLWGPPGIGKSDAVSQVADLISRGTGKQTKVTDIRLLLFSPIDLRGIPMADSAREFTEWLRPKIFDLDPSEDVLNILFLDELSAAPQSVQAAAYQITLNHTVGEHRLPDNTIIIAAGNRVTDRSVAFRMPNALANRLMHFEIRVDFTSWKTWAVSHGINAYVLGYLTYDSSKLYESETGSDEVAFPTPRSWVFVSDILNSMPDTAPDHLFHLISGCVGTGIASEFTAWSRSWQHIAPMEDIFGGKKAALPKTTDEMHAIISAISAYAVSHKAELTTEEMGNCCRYAERFPKDFTMALYMNLLAVEELKMKLLKVREFQNFIKKSGVTI